MQLLIYEKEHFQSLLQYYLYTLVTVSYREGERERKFFKAMAVPTLTYRWKIWTITKTGKN
jgi:hypothetical protein